MKVLWVFLVVCGYASATFYDALDEASDDLVRHFVAGMDDMPSLKAVLTVEHNEEAEQVDHDIKTQLAKALKEILSENVNKIKNLVERSKEASRELLEKAKDISEKLKEAGLKGKEAVEKIRNRIKDWLKLLQEQIGIQKRSLSDHIGNLIQEFDLKNLLQKLKNKIVEKVDLPAIVEYIKNVFGEYSSVGKALIQTVKTKGVEALKRVIAILMSGGNEENRVARSTSHIATASCTILRAISEDADVEEIRSYIIAEIDDQKWKNKLLRALDIGTSTLQSVTNQLCFQGPISDLWNKVKDFFSGLGLGIKSKFSDFGNWLKGAMKSGWEKTKDKAGQLKEIAKTVAAKGKDLSVKAAKQAYQFLDEHKETIGQVLWNQVKNVIIAAIASG